MTRILVVDNYDSFVFNLVHYLAQLGADVTVRRNDEVEAREPLDLGVDGVLLSPGPGRPENAGVCVDMVKEIGDTVPVLGVCLGHRLSASRRCSPAHSASTARTSAAGTVSSPSLVNSPRSGADP